MTVLARSPDRLRKVADECLAAGAPDAHVLVADFDDRPDLYARVAAHAAENPIDILVHNTGGPHGGPLLTHDEHDFHDAMARHLLTAQGLAKLLVPDMAGKGWGRIVCITSLSVRQPIVGLGVSNTVRHAMAAWAKTLSKELPPGVTVNTVLPGYTDTDRLNDLADAIAAREQRGRDEVKAGWARLSPERRLGRPEEIGAAVAWLASDAASFVRGIVLPVDGGRLDGI